MLQFAREHLLIFVDEHVNQKLSKMLDLKIRGMDTNKKNKQNRNRGGGKRDRNDKVDDPGRDGMRFDSSSD